MTHSLSICISRPQRVQSMDPRWSLKMQPRHAIQRSNGVSWKSEPMVHPGISCCILFCLKWCCCQTTSTCPRIGPREYQQKETIFGGKKKHVFICFLFFVCHFPCEQLIGRSLDLNLLLCPLKAVIHLQVSSGRLDLGRSFCFSAGGHVRIACCRVNHARKLIECWFLGSPKPTIP